MSEVEQIVIQGRDRYGSQTFVVKKVMPENEPQHIHICELVRRRDGKTIQINHVRFYGSEFNNRMWRGHGFNRQAVEAVIARYFKSLEKARAEAQAHR